MGFWLGIYKLALNTDKFYAFLLQGTEYIFDTAN